MSAAIARMRNGLFALAMAGVLGFGASQALAAPSDPVRPPDCSPGQCDRQCKAQFGSFASGFCDPFGGCSCAV